MKIWALGNAQTVNASCDRNHQLFSASLERVILLLSTKVCRRGSTTRLRKFRRTISTKHSLISPPEFAPLVGCSTLNDLCCIIDQKAETVYVESSYEKKPKFRSTPTANPQLKSSLLVPAITPPAPISIIDLARNPSPDSSTPPRGAVHRKKRRIPLPTLAKSESLLLINLVYFCLEVIRKVQAFELERGCQQGVVGSPRRQAQDDGPRLCIVGEGPGQIARAA